jgi:nucleoside-diphosphate-sugar epimerase
VRIFVTGASSFVGAWFCRAAAARGHDVIALFRNTALALPDVQAMQGDVREVRPPAGADVVVHLAAKVMADDAREQNRAMLDAVLGWGVPVVYGSSTVVNWPVQLAYADSRIEDEARLRASRLPWLVVRPCAPYGPRLRGHNPAHIESFHQLGSLVRRLPVVPVIGSGRYRRQPVHVEDFAAAILGLLDAGAWNRPFDAGGPSPLTLRAIIAALGAACGRSPFVVSVPLAAAVRAARHVPGMRPDLVATFATDDVLDPGPLARASGVTPRPFDATEVYAER